MRTRRMIIQGPVSNVDNDENSDPAILLSCSKKEVDKTKMFAGKDTFAQHSLLNGKLKNKKVHVKNSVSDTDSLVNGKQDSKALAQQSFSLDSVILPSFSAATRERSLVSVFPFPKTLRTKEDSKWICNRPIFVADSRVSGPYNFPARKRHLICFVCGETDDNLRKCSFSNCPTKFHEMCARLYTGGGYTFDFMSRNKGMFCSRHHCTGCFADHNRTRAFNGTLINCSQCELSWHIKCIPGGCVPDKKSEIVCPRHIAFPNPPHLHIGHCADCQQKANHDEALVKCNNCLRSLHFKCFVEGGQFPDMEDNQELRDSAICNWCKGFDFVRYGQFCMARLSSSKWYPCQVVPNDQFPQRDDPLLGSVGYMVVKWLPYRNKIFHNLISHNRIIAMSEADYFFVTEAKKSDIEEEWQEAQDIATNQSPENSLPEADQLNSQYSNGELVRKITRCKYTTPETRPSKDFIQNTADKCDCKAGLADRCGPSTNCINRTLRIECPEECEQNGQVCNNRMVSNGTDCLPVLIKPTSGRYFGAFIQKEVPAYGFVGEYVGEIITHAEKDKRIERISRLNSLEAQYYLMDLDSHRAIDAHYYGNDMRYVNHSCEPNCTVQVVTTDSDIHIVLVALRKIQKGEELSFDYNMYSKTRSSVPKCRCNAKSCSGILSAQKMLKRKKEPSISSLSSGFKRLKTNHKKINKVSQARKKSAAGGANTKNNSQSNRKSSSKKKKANWNA